jgi:periplasmic protein TonB
MTFKRCLSFCFGVLFASYCSLAAAAEPMLNGIAIHTELSKEQFIGELYSNPLSDNPDTLTASTQAMRMELKILTPDMSMRRFSRLWIEGMAINNTPALLTEQADNMVKFDSLFKGRLIPNDTVVFSYEPGKGVNVSVNDVLLGNIASEKFFGMLLRTWIGKVPLSSDYKESILKAGKVNPELKARFEKIKPSRERTAEIAAWSKIKTQAELAAEKEAAKSAAQASSADSAKQLAAQKAEVAKAEVAKAEAAKLAAAQKATTPSPATATAPAADDDNDKPALTAQTLLARQFYVSDLLKKIRSNTRYPKRALERNQAGSVRISVVVNRAGRVISTSLLEGSQFEQLNEAAMEAINQSAPFPPMPDAVAGNSFEFTVPTTFTLPK